MNVSGVCVSQGYVECVSQGYVGMSQGSLRGREWYAMSGGMLCIKLCRQGLNYDSAEMVLGK